MKPTPNRRVCSQRTATILTLLVLVSASFVKEARAGSWQGIEPFKSRREDVVQVLGKPIGESTDGAIRFAVAGGTVLIDFVGERFVANKRLRPELVGTVLEIVLQHEHSSDTPESLNLLQNKEFVRDEVQNASIFRSNKTGIVYTFLDGKLKTTRYTFSEAQLGRARR